jgi:hypothetical protein
VRAGAREAIRATKPAARDPDAKKKSSPPALGSMRIAESAAGAGPLSVPKKIHASNTLVEFMSWGERKVKKTGERNLGN